MAEPAEPLTAIVEEFLRRMEGGFGGTAEEFLAERGGALDPDTAEMLRILAGLRNRPAQGGELGPYRLLKELGRGAQGVVYLAEDPRLGRKVALKVLAPHAAFGTELHALLGAAGLAETIGAVRRFRREVEAAAKLDHPWICPVYEAGTAGGSQYIAMRYVEGKTLAELVAEARGPAATPSSSPRSSVVRLPEPDPGSTETPAPAAAARGARADVARVCLLVERIARALHAAHEKGLVHRDIKPGNIMVTASGEPVILDFGLARDASSGDLTRTGTLLGTPVYMSPEQIAGKPADRRTDVYSLGVVLYECLALRRPFDAPTLQALCHEILTREPPRLRKLNPDVPVELDIVAETALDKDRERRYRTALDLAEDLRRVRERLPIRARPPGPLLRLRRWAERSPMLAASVAVIFLLLVTGLAVTSHLLRRTSHALVETERERDAKDRALRRTRALALAGAAGAELDHDPQLSLLLAREAARVELLPEVATRLHDAMSRPQPIAVLPHPGAVGSIAFSPDGSLLLTGCLDGVARTWNREWSLVAEFRGHRQAVTAAFSPTGDRIVTASADRTARVWDLSGRTIATLEGHAGHVLHAAFSPDGRTVVTASHDRTVRLWTSDGEPLRTLGPLRGSAWAAAFSPDGSRIAGAGEDGLHVWDLEGNEIAMLHREATFGVAFSRAGDRILSAGALSAVLDSEGRRLLALPSGGRKACFSPDETRVLVARGWELAATLVDVSGEEIATMRGHGGMVSDAALSPDGRLIATASADARIWDLGRAEGTVFRGHAGPVWDAAFTRDGTRVVTAGSDGTARVWRMDGTQELALKHDAPVGAATISPAGDTILTAAGPAARLRRLDGTDVAAMVGHRAKIIAAMFSPDGSRIVTAAEDGEARLWDPGGSLLQVFRHPHNWVKGATFAPDGQRLLTSCRDDHARIWSLGGKLLLAVRHLGHMRGVAFSPDGERFVSTVSDQPPQVCLWRTDGVLLAACRAPRGATDASFSPDGATFATAHGDGTARIWTPDGAEALVLRGHTAGVTSIAFSPDGKLLLTGSVDGTARTRHVRAEDLLRLADEWILRDFARDERLRFKDLLGPDNRSALDADALVGRLRAELLVAADVAERIRSDATLEEGVREHALRLAADLRDDARLLNERSWAVVRVPGKDAKRALRWAERAAELEPSDGNVLNTLGIAQYRTGAHEAARATLLRSLEIHGPNIEDLAFLALACARLGLSAEARGHLEEAKRLAAAGKPTDEQKHILKEAEGGR